MSEPAAGPGPVKPLPADRYHSGVRLATLGLWIVAVVVVYVVLRLVAQAVAGQVAGLGTLLLLVLAVALAQPLAWLAERQLVARWPSGRAVVLEPGQVIWRDKGQTATFELRLGERWNYWRWRFVVRRRRGGRVPSGHHCCALRLIQAEQVASWYAFLAPGPAEALAARYPFYELRAPSDKDKPALGGRDAQFLSAENHRWETGAELDPADFEALLEHLAAHNPEFARTPAAALPV
jgi:hypothetical protein